MHSNEVLIQNFYTCFQQKDFIGMQQCYSNDSTFNDEVFKDLNSKQLRAMWEMLIKRGTDLRIQFGEISANDLEGSAIWMASYSFSEKKRPVVNHIQAKFRFANGKIIEHTDHFNFYTWSRQALGISGWLLGWTTFLQKKVQAKARKGLDNFIKMNNTPN